MTVGVFTGASQQSPAVRGYGFVILLDFGTGTVDLEIQMDDGDWIKDPDNTGISADLVKIIPDVPEISIRLNCTTHSADIRYNIIPRVHGRS